MYAEILSLDDLVTVKTKILNLSLTSGVPDHFKHAAVTPLLKKHGTKCLKNYRQISNLPFLSKLLEKVVLSQLQEHLVSNDLLDMHQSTYKQNHLTETVLLHVTCYSLMRTKTCLSAFSSWTCPQRLTHDRSCHSA